MLDYVRIVTGMTEIPQAEGSILSRYVLDGLNMLRNVVGTLEGNLLSHFVW